MTGILLVAAGAALGAPSRWLVDRAVNSRWPGRFPWGTVAVNMLGSFLLGIVLATSTRHSWGHELALAAGTGFCGAFTTFGTFSFESVRLVETGKTWYAVANVLGSLLGGCLLAAAGWALGSSI